MRYNLGQAAQATGKSKMTIQRAVKSGRISANKAETGEWAIDPSELHRVFPLVTEGDGIDRIMLRDDTPSESSELRAKLEASEQRLRDAQEQVMDLRHRLDQSEDERRRTQAQLTALLTDQRPKPEEPPSGFWKRLLR